MEGAELGEWFKLSLEWSKLTENLSQMMFRTMLYFACSSKSELKVRQFEFIDEKFEVGTRNPDLEIKIVIKTIL